MINILIFIGKIIIDYILGPLILGFIIVSTQYVPNINFPRTFEVKNNKKLINEVLIASLIIFIIRIGFAIFTGDIFFLSEIITLFSKAV